MIFCYNTNKNSTSDPGPRIGNCKDKTQIFLPPPPLHLQNLLLVSVHFGAIYRPPGLLTCTAAQTASASNLSFPSSLPLSTLNKESKIQIPLFLPFSVLSCTHTPNRSPTFCCKVHVKLNGRESEGAGGPKKFFSFPAATAGSSHEAETHFQINSALTAFCFRILFY